VSGGSDPSSGDGRGGSRGVGRSRRYGYRRRWVGREQRRGRGRRPGDPGRPGNPHLRPRLGEQASRPEHRVAVASEPGQDLFGRLLHPSPHRPAITVPRCNVSPEVLRRPRPARVLPPVPSPLRAPRDGARPAARTAHNGQRRAIAGSFVDRAQAEEPDIGFEPLKSPGRYHVAWSLRRVRIHNYSPVRQSRGEAGAA
jgi:hypothetical protein